jgi:AhpD family alkylhydroperoxidase
MIRYIEPVSRKSATGVTARVYDGLRREFGVHAEPITLHSPVEQLLAGAWMLCREHMVAAGRVERSVKEAVATAVSGLNECPFCVDAHTAMLNATGHSSEEPPVAGAIEWALATRAPGTEILRAPPFGESEAPEMIGTATLFHYINRPVSVFCGDSPLPGDGRVLRGAMLRVAGRRFRRFARARPAAGETLDLLPPAELPADFAWARSSPVIAAAWARFAAAVERAGESALPLPVRERVVERLNHWQGEQMGLSLDWIEDGLDGLGAELRPAARLALLVAFAPYRVDETTVSAFGGSDADLVSAVSWAAFAAARRTASWLATGNVDLDLSRSS